MRADTKEKMKDAQKRLQDLNSRIRRIGDGMLKLYVNDRIQADYDKRMEIKKQKKSIVIEKKI